MHTKIEEMNDQLNSEKRKNEKRKAEHKRVEEKLLNEVKKLKIVNQDQSEEIQELKATKGASEMEGKINKLAQEISIINREQESVIKVSEEMLKKKEKAFDEEKEKMADYINQVECKNKLLENKISALQ